MKCIYKYPIKVADEVRIVMPLNTEILCVQVQRDIPCIWALVTKSTEVALRKFRWYGTGHPVEMHSGKYIGTIQMDNGALVFHLFEER
jgi:hypothetical protein